RGAERSRRFFRSTPFVIGGSSGPGQGRMTAKSAKRKTAPPPCGFAPGRGLRRRAAPCVRLRDGVSSITASARRPRGDKQPCLSLLQAGTSKAACPHGTGTKESLCDQHEPEQRDP